MADNSAKVVVPSQVLAPATPAVDPKANWEWVEVPEFDMFAVEHTGVSINFEKFGPGKHFVDPEKAGEIRRLLDLRQRSDLRIMQPTKDAKMKEIMERGGKRAAY